MSSAGAKPATTKDMDNNKQQAKVTVSHSAAMTCSASGVTGHAERATVTAEQIIDCLLAEYEYWKNADCDATIGAIGALANVIGFATMDEWRAEWHPEK